MGHERFIRFAGHSRLTKALRFMCGQVLGVQRSILRCAYPYFLITTVPL